MRATRLAAAIELRLGLRCLVEDMERLALLTPIGDAEPFLRADARRVLAAAGIELGFTHVAVELGDALGENNAPLHRP